MKFIIPGGSGHLGTLLARAFHDQHEVVVLSRRQRVRPWRTVTWDGKTLGPWVGEIDGADVVINLTGRSVNCRYGERHRSEILFSRVESTRAVGEAIARVQNPPHVWLQASTATIYAHRYDEANDEERGIVGCANQDVPWTWCFSHDVASLWEKAVDEARTPRTRKVKMRTAMVMSPDAGTPFDIFLRLARFGLGGAHGDGKQFVSWIHHDDFVRAVRFLIEKRFVSGAINVAAPTPLPDAEFMKAIRDAWGIPFGIGGGRRLLEMAAFVHRTETELLLKSRRVVPARLQQHGFIFRYPTWAEAARQLCDEWRALRGRPAAAPRAQPTW
jgi:uncharacterized protein (TIGR01777 family)